MTIPATVGTIGDGAFHRSRPVTLIFEKAVTPDPAPDAAEQSDADDAANGGAPVQDETETGETNTADADTADGAENDSFAAAVDASLESFETDADDGMPVDITAYVSYAAVGAGTVEITSYRGNFRHITVPEQIGRSKVIRIGENAFAGHAELVSVVLPDTVRTIGTYCFSGCKGLESIAVGTALEKIESCAFRNCSCLTDIALPETLSSIGAAAFEGCASLESIRLPAQISGISDEVFAYCTALSEITLPEGVTSIGDWAFFGCDSLRNIALPSVSAIGDYAFDTYENGAYVPLSGLTMRVGRDSFAENYCLSHAIRYELASEADLPGGSMGET